MLKIYQEQQKEIKEARRRENILNSYIAKEKRKKTRVRRTIWRSSK